VLEADAVGLLGWFWCCDGHDLTFLPLAQQLPRAFGQQCPPAPGFRR
jgi:hypothetical protein